MNPLLSKERPGKRILRIISQRKRNPRKRIFHQVSDHRDVSGHISEARYGNEPGRNLALSDPRLTTDLEYSVL